jgi:hypothetical protein
MRKADIPTRYIRGEYLPCVNVKVHGSVTPAILAEAERESGEKGFAAWAQELLDANKWPDWTWEAAIEQGWNQLQTDAELIFDRAVKVESDGRSSGWAILRGLPPIEEWDAIMVGRFAKWAKWAQGTADFVPNEMAMLLAINTYAAVRERREKIEAAQHAAEAQVS